MFHSDTSALSFDSASDVQAVIATCDADSMALDLPVTRTTSKPTSDLLPDATKQAIEQAKQAYNRMLLALDARRMRLLATQADLATCYNVGELRETLGLALASGLPYSLLRDSFHTGRKQLGSIALPIDKQAMMSRLRESRRLQSLHLSTNTNKGSN